MKNFSISVALLILLFTGCKPAPPKDFKLVFTMEIVKAYKSMIEINSDRSYHIKQGSFLAAIKDSDGKLSDAEFKELTELLAGSWILDLKTTYGFDKKSNTPDDPYKGIIYQLDYSEGNRTKGILIHPNKSGLPQNLTRLLKFLNKFTSDHLDK